MLIPAVLMKEQIIRAFQERYYTEDMLYETGSLDNWMPNIYDCPDETQYQYAIVNPDGKLIGYLGYYVDWHARKAYNFGLISFDKGNPLVGKNVFDKMEDLIKLLHRVEWRMVGGNPAERGYDAFIKKHGGKKHILKDSIMDMYGNYRDDVIYEIVNDN